MTTLEIVIVLILILWLVGFFAIPAAGSAIHILIVVAVVLIVVRLLQRGGTL